MVFEFVKENILKPYFVEMKITAVVMATSEEQAMLQAESHASSIVSDGQMCADSAELIESLQELASFDPKWTGDCIPYGGDKQTPLKMLLPEETPVKDTRTIDMFADA